MNISAGVKNKNVEKKGVGRGEMWKSKTEAPVKNEMKKPMREREREEYGIKRNSHV